VPVLHEVRDAATAFLKQLNITHYFTLTYPGRTTFEYRCRAFLLWIDAIEWMQRRPLGWFRADEGLYVSGLGRPTISPHHHGLLIGADHLSIRDAESIWRAFGDADVRRYERDGGAVEYCQKHAFGPYGDWDIGGKLLSRVEIPSTLGYSRRHEVPNSQD